MTLEALFGIVLLFCCTLVPINIIHNNCNTFGRESFESECISAHNMSYNIYSLAVGFLSRLILFKQPDPSLCKLNLNCGSKNYPTMLPSTTVLTVKVHHSWACFPFPCTYIILFWGFGILVSILHYDWMFLNTQQEMLISSLIYPFLYLRSWKCDHSAGFGSWIPRHAPHHDL